MKPDDFDYVSRLLKERSGLVLTRDKAYLLESRLMPLARKRGLKGLDDLLALVRKRDAAVEKLVVEAMTTNESFFFRDNKPFDQFRSIVLPNLLKARASRKSFRIWSAACSSGQEPYSLAMILKEEGAKLAGWRIEIVGTDLSSEILQKARNGAYSQFEVQRGMPMALLVKYFKKKEENWVIDPSIASMVTFKEWNLLGDLRALGQFDVVFCRNVLIYFDQPTKSKVLHSISQVMADDAVLYLGGAETVLGISDHFKPVPGQRGIYAATKGTGPSLGAPTT
ncbi:chemotaxis protein CheR [Roseospira marina]|uniref:protein-glutamate O-methyltransferase n=1 Tax=Roseospira marina TaxID=140057 RepID=A0A5M6IHC4_9PROT|nr:protein-glutamate O-methyltransferase [Roseospira marina]KAA5606958.1 chemotaxis protein CheR [Roseospira marina]MBB4312864.1 chemotaxis protein methyltransferase CheR [Roseospira marina]MBB5086363.1 chemotaxis protein methyltransferase CheR [Roseospira marina]